MRNVRPLGMKKEFQKFCSTTRCGVRVCVYTQSMTTTNTTNIEQTAKLYVAAFRRSETAKPGSIRHTGATAEMARIMRNAKLGGYAEALVFMLDEF